MNVYYTCMNVHIHVYMHVYIRAYARFCNLVPCHKFMSWSTTHMIEISIQTIYTSRKQSEHNTKRNRTTNNIKHVCITSKQQYPSTTHSKRSSWVVHRSLRASFCSYSPNQCNTKKRTPMQTHGLITSFKTVTNTIRKRMAMLTRRREHANQCLELNKTL
jgi:hypothetical protein